MKRWSTASSILLVPLLAIPAAAQTAPSPDPAPSSTEPAVPPATSPDVVPPGTPPAPPPPAPAESSKPPAAPGTGVVTTKWSVTIYGFAEFDLTRDSTQSFSDSIGQGVIVRPGSLAYNNGRVQTTARNSRFGIRGSAPEFHGMKSSGNLELDFMGNQPTPLSEASFVNNGTFRIRAAYAKLESDYVDMLAGQTYFLFGQGPFFFPMSLYYFGLPNETFGRTQQLRLSHTFKSDAANVDVAVSAQRPPQRDAEQPDFQGGLKLSINSWKGPHTMGSGYAAVDPLTISATGSTRQFRVNEFAAAPTKTNSIRGWGVSLDAMLPIIPGTAKNKANAVTATASFTQTSGASDLISGVTAGAAFPALPNPTMANPAPTYTANVDPGIVQYDAMGNLRALHWQDFVGGIQYYLPPNGEVAIGANYTYGKSDNITDGLAKTTAGVGSVVKQSQYFEAVVLADLTPAIRVGAAWQGIWQTRGDDVKTKHNRVELSVFYFF